MPWHGLAIAANGNIKPCCQYTSGVERVGGDITAAFDNDHMRDLRKQFLDGKRPSGCQSCWQREDQIGISRRMWFTQKFAKYIPDGYQYSTEVLEPVWIQADINLSNVCNLKCRMCGSWASNQWFDEEKKLANLGKRFAKNPNTVPLIQHDIDDLASMLPYLSRMRRIDFKGGEPMLAKNHTQFLDYLIEHGFNSRITLQYTTNGTVINPGILHRLSKFENVRIMFSIEGTGNLYQYIRGGVHTLEEVTENILQYDDLPNVLIGFNVTMQAYNILDLHNIHRFLHSIPLKHGSAQDAFTTICNNPSYLSPFVVPYEIRDLAVRNLSSISDFDHLVGELGHADWNEYDWETFILFTKNLDEWRGEKISDHVPEFARWF